MVGGRCLVVSDFDGTLAGLVADPWAATIVPTAQRALRRLAVRDGVEVVLLSGRAARDLASRARVGGIDYLGDHGSEQGSARRGFRPAALRVEHEAVSPAAVGLVRRLVDEVPRSVPEPWLVVEDKRSSVTFHVRTAPDVDDARARVLAASDAVDPAGLLARSGGRRSLELRSAGASDKGRALRRLIDARQPASVIVLGDDHTDALAFDVLREARASGQLRGLAVASCLAPSSVWRSSRQPTSCWRRPSRRRASSVSSLPCRPADGPARRRMPRRSIGPPLDRRPTAPAPPPRPRSTPGPPA